MDEDVNFALSLVPTLKSLHVFQKMAAKIQIMNVLKLLKWPHISQSSAFASNRPYEGYNPQYQPGPSSVTPYLGDHLWLGIPWDHLKLGLNMQRDPHPTKVSLVLKSTDSRTRNHLHPIQLPKAMRPSSPV